jgi:DNA-binding LacI/PurR family transcriptional regulator
LEAQKRNTLSVCVFSPWLHSQFSDFMVQVSAAIESAMREQKLHADYRLYRAGELKKVCSAAKCRKYDACIILGTNAADDLFLSKKAAEFNNVILLNRKLSGFPCVYGDDRAVCEKMGERLIAGNFYRKYVLCYNESYSSRDELRKDGYRRFFENCRDCHLEEFTFSKSGVDQQNMSDLLANFGTHRICYIFIRYVGEATLLNKALHDGIAVPERIGIVGFDQHSLLSKFLYPQLTTVEPRVYEMMGQALLLARKLKSGEDAGNSMVSAEIIAGNSAIIK